MDLLILDKLLYWFSHLAIRPAQQLANLWIETYSKY